MLLCAIYRDVQNCGKIGVNLLPSLSIFRSALGGATYVHSARPHATYRRVCIAGGVYDVQRYTAIIPRSDVRARCATTRHLQAGVRRRRGVRCPTIHSNKGLTWALAVRPHATYRRVCVAVYDVQRYTAIKV